MNSVDYFLYDNRTPAPWGRDWGIKAATGKLAKLAKLRADFSRYCASLPSQMGALSGFGEAIGGFRVYTGYLLCLTIETRDLAGRPSWSVFGLWCPDSITLSDVIAADVIASARAVAGMETPPEGLPLQPASIGVRAIRIRTSGKAAFRRFDPEASAREVLALLLGAIRANTAMPNILGITASARISELAEAGFDRVYCHPMDDAAARALGRFLTEPESQIEVESWRDERSTSTNEPGASAWLVPPPPSSTTSHWFLWLSAGVALAVCAILIASNAPDRPNPATPSRDHVTSTEDQPRKESTTASRLGTNTPSAESTLLDIGERLQELKGLRPDELRHSKGYEVAQEPVLEAWVPERKKVLDAYATLLDVRERMISKDHVAYYYDDAGKDTEPAKRLEKVVAMLKPLPFDTHPCQTLRYAFAFEFENESSTLSCWCNSVTRLERVVYGSSR